VSEIFPMETRALAIALFYAVGTAIGGISGPYLFGQFIHSGNPEQVATGFLIGAGAMLLGGVAELRWGVRAEQRALEDIATPLTADEVDEGPPDVPEADRAAEDRMRERIATRRAADRAPRLKLGPGYGGTYYSPGMVGTAGATGRQRTAADRALDRELDLLERMLAEQGELTRDELARRLDARSWGPGRYRSALRSAVRDGRAARGRGRIYRAVSRKR
jgi:CubicO group peptidase (beta-lactamase class C family)